MIENKVDSSEHSNQLKKYGETVDIEFSGYNKIFIYLTKDGGLASDDKWLPLSYGEIADIIESIYLKYRSTLGDDIYTLMNHYVSLVRRHIMSDSKIAILCRKIYKQHQQALDLIYEHRPDLQLEISYCAQKIINNIQQDGIDKDDSSKKIIRFVPKEWDNLSFQKTCDRWTNSKRILLFEFINNSQYLGLHLVIGPGDKELKRAIFQTVKSLKLSSFKKGCQLSESGWSHIYKRTILNSSDYIDGDIVTLQKKIESVWKECFYDVELIRKAIYTSPPIQPNEQIKIIAECNSGLN